MKYILLLLPLLLYSKPIKIASYNVQNLFDMSLDGSEYRDYIPNQHNWTEEIVETKLNHTAEVICDVEADIIGLQEVENTHILERLFKRLNQVGCGYKYSTITETKKSSIQVALLSQYPIKSYKSIEVGFGFRDILEVDLDIGGDGLTIFVTHFKAKSRNGVESKRIKSAKVIMRRIDSLPRDREYISLGDFNSDFDEYLHITKKLDDTNGTTAINDILQTKINDRLVSREDMQNSKNKKQHYSPWQELKPYQRWSYKFYGRNNTMDNILLSNSMFDGKGLDYVNNSFRVFKMDYLFTNKGYINRWEYKNSKHTGKGYSDHLPIYAMFDKKPFEANRLRESITRNIEYLYSMRELTHKVVLKDIVVIKKSKNSAIIKQNLKGRGVYLFGCAKELKEGYIYDIVVESIKSYHGLKEVTQIIIKKRKKQIDTSLYYKNSIKNLKQNEIIKDIEGIYDDGYFYTNGDKIALHFRQKKYKPKNNTHIKIEYGRSGYYKGTNLVIEYKKDFVVLE
ncbi:MAG: endonuclease/exonuclease/phosphatase family protein [Sulfurovum sp.]